MADGAQMTQAKTGQETDNFELHAVSHLVSNELGIGTCIYCMHALQFKRNQSVDVESSSGVRRQQCGVPVLVHLKRPVRQC